MKEKKLRAPYASSGVADAIIGLFQRLNPQKIDTKFVVDNSIATSPNAFTATDFAKWFGIIDLEGNVDKNISGKLKMIGEDKDEFIKEKIKESYSDLFEKVNVENAKRDDIVNYFVSSQGLGTGASKNAAALFLHLCYKYNIKIPEELKKKTHTGTNNPKKKNSNKPISKKKSSKVKSNESTSYSAQEQGIEEGMVLIEIRGPSRLYFPLKAKNRKELDNIVNTKIKPIIEAIKLTLPDNHEDKVVDGEEPALT